MPDSGADDFGYALAAHDDGARTLRGDQRRYSLAELFELA